MFIFVIPDQYQEVIPLNLLTRIVEIYILLIICRSTPRGPIFICRSIPNVPKFICGSTPVVLFWLCWGTHFATCDHASVHIFPVLMRTGTAVHILTTRDNTCGHML